MCQILPQCLGDLKTQTNYLYSSPQFISEGREVKTCDRAYDAQDANGPDWGWRAWEDEGTDGRRGLPGGGNPDLNFEEHKEVSRSV